MSDIVGVRGDTEIYDLTIVDADGVRIDLTDAELWFTIKVNRTDKDTLALIRKTTGNGIVHADQVSPTTRGKASVTLLPADTVKMLSPYVYYYDVQLKTIAEEVTTVVSGSFTLQADITFIS